MKDKLEFIHTPNDGRGKREVYLDGIKVMNVVYADTLKGIVRVTVKPLRLKPNGEPLQRTYRGKVVVKMSTEVSDGYS